MSKACHLALFYYDRQWKSGTRLALGDLFERQMYSWQECLKNLTPSDVGHGKCLVCSFLSAIRQSLSGCLHRRVGNLDGISRG